MRKSLMKLLGVVVALVLSLPAAAVGMGGISVSSALGQPLRADIELMSVGRAEKSSLVARIASPDAYRGAGLEYPFGNKFSFQVENRANGDAYLRVSSAQPVNDPFVSLLVELSWASGRLLREYTFLLDPPGYVPVQEADIAPQVLAPMPAAPAFVEAAPVQDESRQQEPVEEAPQSPVRATAPADERGSSSVAPAPSAPAPLAAQPPQRSRLAETGAGDITVKSGDTLSAIAERNRPVDVSLERMLVALYRANASQFDGKNMNRIRTGKILRLPDRNELSAVNQPEAVKEIRAQSADWHAYRQRLASAAPVSSRPLESQQAVAGKITSSVTDKTPVAKESSKEVLKLSKGETPGDRAAAEPGTSTGAQEDAIAKAKALKDEQERLALLEQNLKDMQRLRELKSEAAVLAQQAASGVIAESAVAAASAVKPAKAAKPKPVAAPKAPAPEPALLDQILAEPLYLAGGAIVLLGLGGLALMLARRKQAFAASPVVQPRDAGAATRIATPVAPSPDTGDFTVVNAAGGDAAHSDDVDPISEADLFLNFGRDAQAEEILKEALLNTPGDHRIHLKLLGIYANRKDVNSFAAIAHQLQGSGDDEAWEQAAAMGRKLEPGNPMYGGGGMSEAADGAAVRAPAPSPEPDFLLESAEPEAAALDLDFDLGLPPAAEQEAGFQSDAGKTVALSAEDVAAAQIEAMDFDVTSIPAPETGPASTTAPAEMDFDVTSAMDFELASPSPSSSLPELEMPDAGAAEPGREVASAKQGAALPSLDDLIFDVAPATPSTASAPEAHETEEPVHAADDALAFTLDFPTGDEDEKPARRDEEMGLAGINLNLDDAGAPDEAPEEEHDEHWHEVATKLDLAKAYQEMGDVTGAREILEEVLLEGDAAQQETAQSILDQLS